MQEEYDPEDSSRRPPLRDFEVQLKDGSKHQVTAHLVFDNTNRGEGLLFRRYYDGSVRTERVAEFAAGSWQYYKEINKNG